MYQKGNQKVSNDRDNHGSLNSQQKYRNERNNNQQSYYNQDRGLESNSLPKKQDQWKDFNSETLSKNTLDFDKNVCTCLQRILEDKNFER